MLKPIFIDWGSPADSEIKLSNFVKWTKSIKVELPPNFPGTTAPNPIPKDQSSPDKNERSTLLTLIAVLAKELQLDISYPSKTAGVIEGLTTRLGAHVSARAIENHLKRIGTTYAKSFGERERTTLLILIATLCKELKLDISNSTRAASLIESLIMSKGAHIAAATIKGCLSRIPKALEKRSN